MDCLTAKLVNHLTSKIVNHLTAKLMNRLTAKLVDHLTSKLVVVNLVKSHLYTCQLSRLRRESHALGVSLTPAG